MDAAFCVEALEEALARHGTPDIFNTDQGAQFTSQAFTDVLLKEGVAISMDGKGARRDDVFVERLWRSIKYEEIYLRAYGSVGEARASIGQYLTLHNGRRPHSSLHRKTPDQAYFDRLPQPAAARTRQSSTQQSAKHCSDKRSHLSGRVPSPGPCQFTTGATPDRDVASHGRRRRTDGAIRTRRRAVSNRSHRRTGVSTPILRATRPFPRRPRSLPPG